MKVLLLALTSVLTVMAESDVRDLLYFPEQGSFWGITSRDTSTTEYEVGTSIESETDISSLTQNIYYIPAKGLAIGAQFSRSELDQDVESSGSTTRFKSDGNENPQFEIVKRMQWQEGEKNTLDIGAAYSPDVFDNENSTEDKDGTVASGNSSLSLFTRLGKKYDEVEWSILAQIDFEGEAESEDADDGAKSTTDAKSDILLEFNLQKNVNEKFSVLGSFAYSMYGESSSEDEDGDKTVVESYSLMGLSAGAKFAFNKDFMVSATYSFSLPVDVDIDSDASGEYELEDVSMTALSLAATYRF